MPDAKGEYSKLGPKIQCIAANFGGQTANA